MHSVKIARRPQDWIYVNFGSATDAGSLIGAVIVTTNVPGNYVGTISISGTNASSSAAYLCSLYVGQSNITADTYVINLTATP
jgi:hypothetical protein